MKNNFFYKDKLTNIYERSSQKSPISSQIVYGEEFKILAKNKDWLKIKILFDNYIGYIKDKNYTMNHKPSHKVSTLKANIFNRPNNKTKYYLPFASKISIIQENKKFVEFEKNQWLRKNDLKKINHVERNYLKIFKLFLKTKYLWGGKTYKGIDCSALLQLYYYYNNSSYPRDTKDQMKYSKKKLEKGALKKGDIIFWKGHVAICVNSRELVHAYGPKKKVLLMSITKTIDRIKKTARLSVKKISSIKY